MNSFRTFVLILMLLAGAGNVKSQSTPDSEQILMRTFEYFAGTYSSEIVLSYGDGKTETIELASLKAKNREVNTDKVNYVIRKILKSGYKLLAAHSGGDVNFQSSTYIFVKE